MFCSNLPWLMARIQSSALSTVSITLPNYLVLDDRDYLAVLATAATLNRYNRTTMTLVSSTPISLAKALSYYNKQYFITQGIVFTSQLMIYSTATITNIENFSIPKDPRDYVFIRNGSVMVVTVQTTDTIQFFNVTSPTSFTLALILTAPAQANTLYRVNDTLLYMSTDNHNDPMYTLTYNSSTNNWTWGTMPSTMTSIPKNFQSTIDACGRLWVSTESYGVRIFDTYGTKS